MNNKSPLSWASIKEYLQTPQGKKTLVIFIIVLIILIIAGMVIYNRYFRHEQENKNKSFLPGVAYQKQPEEKKEICKLDGALHPAGVANRHPLAVMIENHPDARPQTGLDKASIIYEAIAEGGITRFMAVYGPNAPEKIGPVRSARTFYLDWDLEYDAYYAHVGGNIDALDLIPKIGLKDLDQFKYGSQAYWREPQKAKATEHTMYTSAPKLYDLAKSNSWDITKSDFAMLDFKEDLAKSQRPTNQKVKVSFSTQYYEVTWQYNPETNSYQRVMAGLPHKDAQSDEQLTAKNIIVQEVKRTQATTRINEQGWEMDTVGSGKIKVFLDGKTMEGRWEKKDRDSRTLFYDAEGNKIKFNPGVFWYEIVPPGAVVTAE